MAATSVLGFLKGAFEAYRDDLRLGENDTPYVSQLAQGTSVPIAANAFMSALEKLDLSRLAGGKPAPKGENWAMRAQLEVGEGGGYNANNLGLVLGPPSSLHTDAVSLGRN